MYIYIYMLPPPFLTSLFLLHKLWIDAALQQESTFSVGMALKKIHAHIQIYTHAFGHSIVTLASARPWSSNIYNMGMTLWPNARFEYIIHFLRLIDATFRHRIRNMFPCLVCKIFWRDSCQEVGLFWRNTADFEGLFEGYCPVC